MLPRLDPAAFAAFGIWPALPLLGRALLGDSVRTVAMPVRLAIYAATGLALLSWPLLLLAAAGRFHPMTIGLAGWGLVAGCLLKQRRSFSKPRLSRSDWLLVAGVSMAAFFFLNYPNDAYFGGRDQGVYTHQGVHIAKTGRLDLPWPTDDRTIRDAMELPWWFKDTPPTLTIPFFHLTPVWLAQSYGTGGIAGLRSLNGVFAALTALLLFGILRLLTPARYAVAGTLVFALNPAQLWNARVTLSEILMQLLVWLAMLLLAVALREKQLKPAVCAGVALGLAGVAHIDACLVWPCVLAAHLAHRLSTPEAPRREWLAFLGTGLASAMAAYAFDLAWSGPYLRACWDEMSLVLLATLLCACVDLGVRQSWLERIRSLFSRRVLTVMSGLLVTIFAYGYWLRPWLAARGVGSVYAATGWPYFVTYLSLPVALLAFAGVINLLWRFARGEGGEHLPWLAIGAGFSALYLTNPFIQMWHFWASRRYIPGMLPAFVLAATVGASGLLGRLGHLPRLIAQSLLGAFLVWFTLQSNRLLWTLRENHGAFAMVQQIAAAVPAGAALVVEPQIGERWPAPLQLAEGRPVFIIAPGPAAAPAVEQLLAPSKWVFFLGRQGLVFPRFDVEEAANFDLHWRQTEDAPRPFPQRVLDATMALELKRLGTFERTRPLRNVNLLNTWDPEVLVRGFYEDEDVTAGVRMWSKARATINLPMFPLGAEDALLIEAAASGPAGAAVVVRVNGRVLLDEQIPPGPWRRLLPLSGPLAARQLRIQLATSTFNPIRTDPRSRDSRVLGVQLSELRIVSAPRSPASPPDIPPAH